MEAAPAGAAPYIQRNWNARAVAQTQLRDSINWWCSFQVQRQGLDEASMYRLFWRRFKIDVASAQLIGGDAVNELRDNIWKDINAHV